MLLALELLALDQGLERGPERGPEAAAWRAALEEALRQAGPDGALMGGRTTAAVSRFEAQQAEAFQRWVAVESSLEPAVNAHLRVLAALALTPLSLSVHRQRPGVAPVQPEASFPLPALLADPDPRARALALRLRAWTLRAAGFPEAAVAHLEAALALSQGDARAEGLCLFSLAEIINAPHAPLASGEVWLYEAAGGVAEVPGAAQPRAPGDEARALRHLDEAEARLGDWAPGACALAAARGLIAARAGRLEEARERLAEAERLGAGGFPRGAALARLHRALVELALGKPADREAATALGRWGREAAPGFALGLGMVALVEARRALEEGADAPRAVAAAELAVDLLEALGAAHAAGLALLDGATYAGLAFGPEHARSRLDAAWARALTLRGTALDEGGLMLAAHAAFSALTTAMATQDPEALLAAQARMDLLLAWRPGLFERTELTLPALQAALIRASAAADEGDRAGLEAALTELERQTAALPEPGRWLWESTLLAWRQRHAQAAERFLAYQAARAAAPPTLDLTLSAEEAASVAPQIAAAEAALARQRRRDALVERAEMASRCEQWALAGEAISTLDAEYSPDGWLDPVEPWRGLALRAGLLSELGREEAAAEAWARAWESLEARRARLAGDQGRGALSGDPAVRDLGLGAARTALRRREAALARGEAAAARALLEEGFAWSERVRARAMTELLAAAPLRASAPEPLRRWQELRTRLSALEGLLGSVTAPERRAALEARVAAARAALIPLERALSEDSAALARLLRPDAEPLSLAAARAALPDGGLLLAFDVHGRGLSTWALPREGEPTALRRPLPFLELPARCRELAERCAGGLDPGEAGAALAALLLDPVSELLERASRLLLAPAGPLWRVPWAALPWRGRPLVETHAISLVPSAGALRWLRPEAPVPLDRAVIVGDPARMAWSTPGGEPPVPLSPLPGAAAEAAAVAGRFQAPRLLIGEEATLDAVLAALPGARVLHLATHGRHEPQAPLLSALTLASGDLLDVATLYGAQVEAELVVLSACETGRLRARGGEPHGLARGVLAAGGGRVVLSLWPVDDAATARLMDAFYAELDAGCPVPEALRRAQRATREAQAGGPRRDLILEPVAGGDERLWAGWVVLG